MVKRILIFIILVSSIFAIVLFKSRYTDRIGSNPKESGQLSNETSIFKIDDTGVYYTGGITGDVLVASADPKTFVFLGGIYGKDHNFVFSCQVECQKVEGTDIDTFEVLDFEPKVYARDILKIYKDGTVLSNIDPGSFKPFNQNYYSDKNGVYMNGTKLVGADMNSFRTISDQYALDVNNVYYETKILELADPATFQVLPDLYAKDASHTWFNGELTENTVVADITKELAKKYSKSSEDVEITVEIDTGDFAKGSVRFNDEFGGAIWFGAKQNGKWTLAADGQGPMICETANSFAFPIDLVPECIDESNNLVER